MIKPHSMNGNLGFKLVHAAVLSAIFCASIANCVANEVPCVNVPYVSQKVVIDGRIGKNEWRDAAVITDIHPLGSHKMAHPLTTFYCQYNDDALFVAVRCFEANPAYPRAYPRKPTGDLAQDDSVQVVLGMANPLIIKRGVLQMGGYRGAMGTKIAAADYYYQFTVNSLNARSRTYNETPLQRPLFNSAVQVSKSGWTVEMKIPFKSIGLTKPRGKDLFANLIRFRPPTMLGWYLPHFGGYYPMPFGRMVLLKPGTSKSKVTRQKLPHENISHLSAYQSVANTRPTITLGYYPLSGVVAGTFTLPPQLLLKELRADLFLDGHLVKSRSITRTNVFDLVQHITAGAQPCRRVEAKLLDSSGEVLAQSEKTYQAVAAPKWFGCNGGLAYVNHKIPKPWIAPVVQSNEIHLTRSTLTIGKFGLFSSIRDRLGDLLAGQARIEVEAGQRHLDFHHDFLSIRRSGNYVVTDATLKSGRAELETRSRIDYDGFTVVKFRLLGVAPNRIHNITLSIPLTSKDVRFVLPHVLVQNVRALSRFGFECGTGPLWVGCEDKGIEFSYDNINPFLSTNVRSRIRLIQGRSISWLNIDFVDGAGQVPDKGHVFRFFLQPTPTKPRSRIPIHKKVEWVWENWADHEGQIDLSKLKKLKKWTASLSKKGKIGSVYVNQGLAENAPAFVKYRSDLEIQPPWMFYRRAYNPGKGVPCYATSKLGPDGQRICYGLEQLATKAGVRGIYDDGMSIAWPDDSLALPYRPGQKPSWNKWTLSRVTAQRNFLKRVRGIVDALGGKYNMTAHTGGGLDISTLSFYDDYLEGEQLARYRPGFQIPLPTFIVGYSGQPFGFRGTFYDRTWRHQRGENLSLIYCLLTDCDYEGDPAHYLDLVRDFDSRQSIFYPYWRLGSNVCVLSNSSSYKPPISYYLNKTKEEALITVGNLQYYTNKVTLSLKRLFPGRRLQAWDVFANDTRVALDHRQIVKTVAGWRGAVWRVKATATDTHGQPAWTETGYHRSEWRVTEEGGKLRQFRNSSTKSRGKQLTIYSEAEGRKARSTFIAHSILPTGHIRLRLRHSGRVAFYIGNACIYYQDGWHTRNLRGGILFQPAAVFNHPVEVEVSVDDGVLNASYDSRPLAADMNIKGRGETGEFAVATGDGDSVTVDPIEMGSAPYNIYKAGNDTYELAHVARASNFRVASYRQEDWSFNTNVAGVRVQDMVADLAKNHSGAVLRSTIHQSPAIATFAFGKFGKDATVAMWIKQTGRLQVTVGGAGLLWDSGWKIAGQIAGWNNGHVFQPKVVLGRPVLLVLTLKDGLLNATYNNKALAKNLSLVGIQRGNNLLRISTWAGDSLGFAVQELSTFPRPLFKPVISQPIL